MLNLSVFGKYHLRSNHDPSYYTRRLHGEEELKTLFPGLSVRPIGPGDDVVVSSEALQKWHKSELRDAVDKATTEAYDHYQEKLEGELTKARLDAQDELIGFAHRVGEHDVADGMRKYLTTQLKKGE